MLKINLLPRTKNHFKNISWQEELKNAFKNNQELSLFLKKNIPITNFPIFITQNMARRIKEKGPDSALWKQFIPNILEQENNLGFSDPIGDIEKHSSKQIIHRYKNRALFLPNINCPIHCRFCFRQHNLTPGNDLFTPRLKHTIEYLQEHPQIEELIFSGGDPLLLSDDKLYDYFNIFKEKTNIKYIRIHTKALTTLPSRFNREFLEMIKLSSKLFSKMIIVFHCNHIDEIDHQSKNIIKKLQQSGVELLLQTVLLKNINDDLETLKKLFLTFSNFNVRPYYLHHPDRVKNAMHFYLSIEEGRLLYGQLRDQIPGWAIPHYVVDLPLGRGKTLAYNGESLLFSGTFIDKNGETCSYT